MVIWRKSSTFVPDFDSGVHNQINSTTMSDKVKLIIKVVIAVAVAALTALGASLGLTSCNVTRTVTTKSEYFQRGDTACTIVTKTVETYDAKKNMPLGTY